jgi:predicted transcriptional regulator of viral defense system
MKRGQTAPPTDRRLHILLRSGGTARSRDLVAGGVPRMHLSRMVAAGKLQRVARGLYALPSYEGGEHRELVAVAKRVPAAVFCLLTALRLHGLSTQAPFEVWIAIGNSDHAPRMDYPPLRIVRFSAASLAEGVETKRVGGIQVRVTSVAKTVVDCFKFRNKIGLEVALEALREARRERKASANDLWRFAKINRVANVMRPYMEAIA